MRKITFLFISLFYVGAVFSNANADIQLTCPLGKDINACIDEVGSGSVILEKGTCLTEGITLKSNISLEIPRGTIVKLDDNAQLNEKAFGGVVNAVILAKGTQEKPLENIHIVLDGEVDGNKGIHTYENGGCEGVNLAWIKNYSIKGSGLIHSANGDGIDIDAAENLVVDGVTVHGNGGSGIHFGSTRPIHGSKNNIIMNVKSYANGFERKRNGLDLSWPSPNGAVFVNCLAKDNYRNFEIKAVGGVLVNCQSLSSGKVIEEDDFSGAEYAYVNNQDKSNPASV